MKALNISTYQRVNRHQHWLSEAMSGSGCGWVAKKGRIQRQGASKTVMFWWAQCVLRIFRKQ